MGDVAGFGLLKGFASHHHDSSSEWPHRRELAARSSYSGFCRERQVFNHQAVLSLAIYDVGDECFGPIRAEQEHARPRIGKVVRKLGGHVASPIETTQIATRVTNHGTYELRYADTRLSPTIGASESLDDPLGQFVFARIAVQKNYTRPRGCRLEAVEPGLRCAMLRHSPRFGFWEQLEQPRDPREQLSPVGELGSSHGHVIT